MTTETRLCLIWIIFWSAVMISCFYKMHQVELDFERTLAAGAPWWVQR